MNYGLSLMVILTALFFLFSPFLLPFCAGDGANIGGVLWLMFVMPLLLILVNFLDDNKAYFVAYGHVLVIAAMIIFACVDVAADKIRKRDSNSITPPTQTP